MTILFPESNTDINWSFPKKVSFRFFFILLLLYIIFNNNGAFPYFYLIVSYPTMLLHQFIPWFSEHVLGYIYDYTIFTNGSGDTSYDYVLLACISMVAGAGTVIWSLLDRKRSSYNKLYYWLLVVVRCYVALTLINYGMVKIIKLQFPSPTLYRLLQPYGDSSPMGLAWTFLGFSKGYNLFMGIIEVSAVLLLFRRTLIIGGFLTLAATIHVMSMNYFYDVPVKILSTALVVMTLFILAPYLKRILYFFLSGKAVNLPLVTAPVYRKKWMYYVQYGFKYLVIVIYSLMLFPGLLRSAHQYGALAPKPPLYGIYKTEQFMVNNIALPPLATDTVRWKELVIQRSGSARVKTQNDSLKSMAFKIDTVKKQISLYLYSDTNNKSTLNYSFPDRDHLYISGKMNKDSVEINLKKVDMKTFRLLNRGFHWVNEYPYNR